VAIVLQQMGNAYLKKGDYNDAVNYARQAASLSRELALDQVLKLSLVDLVEAEEKLGNIGESHKYLKEFVSVNDTLSARNNRKIASELEAKYQSQKKEIQLLSQEKTIRHKNLLNYLLAGSVLSIVLIFFLSYRTYHQKQKLQQQKITELEREKKLAATEAVLKGEEKERTRLARDLHDGLGGMLSGIKYSFQNMKGNLVMNPENHRSFERGLDMLDTSIKEMRRVAHNLMPEALVKFGLDTALKDFCNDINQSGVLKLKYQSIGLENALIEQTMSINIYRIVQELINNTIKHAGANMAIVQIAKNNNQITVTVEDNGRGFDTSILRIPTGIGWNNIQSRVEFLKGKLDIKSSAGEGTSVQIEFES
jgi:signal transduction histidine kinase